MMGEGELRDLCVRMMGRAWPSYLATMDLKGRPRVRALFNLRNEERFPGLVPLFRGHDDDMMVLFTTNTSSSKVREVEAEPAVAAYFSVPEESWGLMLGGEAEIVMDDSLRRAIWQEGWERYYPGGFADPDHSVLRLLPTEARGWYRTGTFEFAIR
jgi:general stress protein 26